MFKRKNVVLTRDPPQSRTPGPRINQNAVDQRNRPGDKSITLTNPLIRPSLVDSVPCVSTGSRTLDKALGHGGIPLGTLTLIEEHGTTDFSAAVLKSGAALAVHSTRSSANVVKSRVICVGIPEWLRALPSVVDGNNSKHRSQSKVTDDPANSDRMKIAWRYAKYTTTDTDLPNAYCPDVDFKSTLLPSPQSNEVTYILGSSLDELSSKLTSTLQQQSTKSEHVRIILPSFLHPAAYRAECCDPKRLLPFLATLKALVQKHGNAVALISIPLQLYPRTRSVIAGAELIADTCIELEPFDSGDEKVQGFLHINRISKLSDRGDNVEQRRELSFRLGRYQFEVAPYAIPVEVQAEIEKEADTGW